MNKSLLLLLCFWPLFSLERGSLSSSEYIVTKPPEVTIKTFKRYFQPFAPGDFASVGNGYYTVILGKDPGLEVLVRELKKKNPKIEAQPNFKYRTMH